MPDIDLVDEKVFDLAMDNEMDTNLPIHQHPSNDQQIVSSQSSTPDQELADCTGQVLSVTYDNQELKQVVYIEDNGSSSNLTSCKSDADVFHQEEQGELKEIMHSEESVSASLKEEQLTSSTLPQVL